MRLNRKWFYLGGLVTILTLLLTLTLVLPAGAVGQLDRGSLASDVDYVSPDSTNIAAAKDRTVAVTLTNPDLDINKTVEEDGDFEAVVLEIVTVIDAQQNATMRVSLDTEADQDVGDGSVKVLYPKGTAATPLVIEDNKILPIVGDIVVDGVATDRHSGEQTRTDHYHQSRSRVAGNTHSR